MIVLDANLLLYAYGQSSPFHARARGWIESVFSGDETVGLPWQTITAFVRIATDPRVPGYRRAADEVLRVVEEWLRHPRVQVLAPGDDHWAVLRRMIVDGQASGPLVSDAELAALTIEHGGILYTADRDFARFPGLRWVNPLA